MDINNESQLQKEIEEIILCLTGIKEILKQKLINEDNFGKGVEDAEELSKTFNIAINSIKTLFVPIKPEIEYDCRFHKDNEEGDCYFYRCQYCGELLGIINILEKPEERTLKDLSFYKRCPGCGQRIDWSDEE